MGSTYPSSLDDFAEASPSNLGDSDTSGRTHSERHDDVEAAVEQIEETLGTLPQGSDATVRDRVAAVESDAASALSAFNTHTHASTPPALSASGGALTGALELPDGTAGAPSLTNTGDTNTGLLFPAADTVAVSTGGTERVRVDSSGNVGIGVSPTQKVDIYDTNARIRFDTSTTTAKLYYTNAAANTYQPVQILASDTSIIGNGNERMKVASDGLITGSGTSLGAWTAYTPTVSGNSAFTLGNGTVSGAYCRIGKIVAGWAQLVIGATTTLPTSYTFFSLPVNSILAAYGGSFTVFIVDASTGKEYTASASYGDASKVAVKSLSTGGEMLNISGTSPITFATGDTIQVHFMYEAA